MQLAVELVEDFVADGESQSNALSIDLCVGLFNLSEQFEQLADIFLLNADSCIFYCYLYIHMRFVINMLKFNFFWSYN